MTTFSELYSDINELKKVNLAQRRKQARRMAKLAKSAAFKKNLYALKYLVSFLTLNERNQVSWRQIMSGFREFALLMR